MPNVIIGTAGHIDHGKTALVKALTGTETDRLKEERERGITIDLGYAFLSDEIALIDVPGHERFIKNMVAGAASVDFAALVVAADDGIMPQTREHFDILRLLGVESGIVVLTKCDLAENDWVDLVEEEIRAMIAGSFLDGQPIARVDSLSGRGIEELRKALVDLAVKKGARDRLDFQASHRSSVHDEGLRYCGHRFRAVRIEVSVEDKLELLPAGIEVRVRGIQSQGRKVDKATAGMRVALNTPSLTVDDVSRGDVLATPKRLAPTFMLDAECRILESSPMTLEQRQRIRLHIGTKEVMARAVVLDGDRIEPGGEGLIQLRLEERTSTQRLDRYVIRRYSPQVTIGGGRILDTAPSKHRRRHSKEAISTLRRFSDAKVEKILLGILEKEKVLSFEELVVRSGLDANHVEEAAGALCIEGDLIEIESKGARHLTATDIYRKFKSQLVESLQEYHKQNPLREGARRAEILSRWKRDLPEILIRRFVDLLLSDMEIKSPHGDLIASYGFEVRLSKKQAAALAAMERALLEGGFKPPDIASMASYGQTDEKAARELIQVLVDREKAINLEGKVYFHADIVKEGASRLARALAENGELTMSDFRVLVDTSRKYAMPLLNYFDNQGVTMRRGDVRLAGPNLPSFSGD